jgi:DNA replication protein DnaC
MGYSNSKFQRLVTGVNFYLERKRRNYIAKSEPNIFIGDSGTGKTHLLTGLEVAACRQERRVRFATAAG